MNPKEDLIQALIEDGYLKTPRIIEAFRQIDRADFVRPEYRSEAYGNYPLPIGEGQTISQPLTVAFMLELLEPKPGEKILDVGSGSGWTTALLAYAVSQKGISNFKFPISIPLKAGPNPKLQTTNGRAIGIERVGELCEFGRKNLAKYFTESTAKIICGDGTLGLPEQAPFDKVLAGAAASREIPQSWRDQLEVGGRIVAPIAGSIWLFMKKPDKEWEEKEFPGFAFVPLVKNSKPVPLEAGLNSKQAHPAFSGTKFKIQNTLRLKTAGYWLLALSLLLGALFTNEIYRPHTAFSGSKSVEVPQGFGSRKIAELLKKEGIIRSKWAFVTYASIKGRTTKLKPGSYVFSSQDAIPAVLEALVLGGTNEVVLIIPEGWNSREIAGRLMNLGLASEGKFLEVVEAENLEGYLFPDTYRVFKNASVEEIIKILTANFEKKVTPELRQEVENRGKTLSQIITMASLIEKEVQSDEDRALVSGILWKRLEIGMALQVDATISYITGKKTTKIPREETKIDSPYNTYKYPGLPPGPIANPGLSAIKAAVYPQKSPYLYYLSAPDGQTIFSQTLEEHNKAKSIYLR